MGLLLIIHCTAKPGLISTISHGLFYDIGFGNSKKCEEFRFLFLNCGKLMFLSMVDITIPGFEIHFCGQMYSIVSV